MVFLSAERLSFKKLAVVGLVVGGRMVPSIFQVRPPSVERAQSVPPWTN